MVEAESTAANEPTSATDPVDAETGVDTACGEFVVVDEVAGIVLLFCRWDDVLSIVLGLVVVVVVIGIGMVVDDDCVEGVVVSDVVVVVAEVAGVVVVPVEGAVVVGRGTVEVCSIVRVGV